MKAEAIRESRRLFRAARCGTLATTFEGQPFASLITPATAPDLSVLLLLSDLSEHSRHLRADSRCAILVTGKAPEANPQTTPRVTVTGLAEISDDPALKARYLAVHPYAALYADFADFHLWRVRIAAASYVGGFGRAARVTGAELAPEPQAVAIIAAAEASIIKHCNEGHSDALGRIAAEPGDWGIVAVDVDGCDLARGEQVRRVHWREPVRYTEEVQAELVRMTKKA